MTQNLEIRWSEHASDQATVRGISKEAAENAVFEPIIIRAGKKNLREEFIGVTLLSNERYPIVVVCSAATTGLESWQKIVTVYADRRAKNSVTIGEYE